MAPIAIAARAVNLPSDTLQGAGFIFAGIEAITKTTTVSELTLSSWNENKPAISNFERSCL
jgi:hypothetical protein